MQVQSNAVGPDSQQVLLVRVLVSLYLMNEPHSHRVLYSGRVIKVGKKIGRVRWGCEKTGCSSRKILALADTSNPD